MKTICVVGLGYIGLPTAAMFAANGFKVLGLELKKDICDTINSGHAHISEEGLGDMVSSAVKAGLLTASTEIAPCDAYIVSVPTPIKPDKTADLSYVVSAAGSIAPVLKKGDLVILESTVPPRCTADIFTPELEKSGLKAGADFLVAHCPERVLPGSILDELVNNNRIIGGVTPDAAEAARDLYLSFVKGEIYLTDTQTAELCKLMENTYRDVNIALANELAKLCETLGVNAWDVISLANRHPRVNLHQPGPGVGGHCIAVDPWFVVEKSPELTPLIRLSRNINDSMPAHTLETIKRLMPSGGKLLILGCTYKPNVGDMRESPIVALQKLLEKEPDIKTVISDPLVPEYNADPYEAANGASLILLGVNHSDYKSLDLKALAVAMAAPVVLDTRNFIDPEAAAAAGFSYHLLGCGK